MIDNHRTVRTQGRDPELIAEILNITGGEIGVADNSDGLAGADDLLLPNLVDVVDLGEVLGPDNVICACPIIGGEVALRLCDHLPVARSRRATVGLWATPLG